MLVDDNMINNFMMKKLINVVDKQLQVRDFTLPAEAFSILEEVDPSVIFLDLNMPVMDGWQFLEGMVTRNLKTKVYILTSSTSELDRLRSRAFTNVVSLLTKPVARETVAAILQDA